jgi:hypothetical protein
MSTKDSFIYLFFAMAKATAQWLGAGQTAYPK